MKGMKAAFLGGLPLLVLFLLAGCMQEEDFSTSLSDRLRFSTDTVAFDTVISGQPTNTRTFMVYNPGRQALRISRAYLDGGSASAFRVNVDGTYLTDGEAGDFELYGEDSLRVFLEMTAPAGDSDLPVAVEDDLNFVLESGLTQSVHLVAYGQDVIVLRDHTVERDTTLAANRPYQVFDSLVVAPGATLTLQAGTRLYFHPDARLVVHGTLKADGELGNEVMMRGDRMGNMFSNQPYDLIPGQWGGIELTSESYGNTFNHCDIHSGTFGLSCDSSDTSREKARIENSVIHNMSGDVLTARSCNLFVGNSQLTNAGGNCVTLTGGSVQFVHCTIANFYSFSGGRGVALYYTNADGATDYPLLRADFENCLITGYSDDEIMGIQSDRGDAVAFNYLFRNCLLDTPEFVDERVQGCLWDNDEAAVYREDNFTPAFDLSKLLFTFTPAAESQAVGNADAAITRNYYPYARHGRRRLDNGSRPDIGCYQHYSSPENGQ